jgi:hypothetical protein
VLIGGLIGIGALELAFAGVPCLLATCTVESIKAATETITNTINETTQTNPPTPIKTHTPQNLYKKPHPTALFILYLRETLKH